MNARAARTPPPTPQQIEDLIKEREIGFVAMHPDPHQAQSALAVLQSIKAIEQAELVSERTLRVRYSIRHITLEIIESALTELGFHLDNTLLYRLKRALYYYTEAAQLANLGLEHDKSNYVRDVFVNHYQQHDHGCRDPRPPHWRSYR